MLYLQSACWRPRQPGHDNSESRPWYRSLANLPHMLQLPASARLQLWRKAQTQDETCHQLCGRLWAWIDASLNFCRGWFKWHPEESLCTIKPSGLSDMLLNFDSDDVCWSNKFRGSLNEFPSLKDISFLHYLSNFGGIHTMPCWTVNFVQQNHVHTSFMEL